MTPNTQKESKVHTQSTDVSAGLTVHPEYSEISLLIKFKEFGLINSSDTKLTLHSWDEWRTLKKSTSKCLQRPGKCSRVLKGPMKSKYSNVLLSYGIIRLSAAPKHMFALVLKKLYSPAPCCDFTNLVALSMHTIKHPVTFGSNVPLCPVFSQRSMRLNQATTSWEDGFEGLSRLITPDLIRITIRICYCL